MPSRGIYTSGTKCSTERLTGRLRQGSKGKTACKQDIEGVRKVRKMKKFAACMQQTEKGIKKYRQLFSSCR